jgi:hypothetical protein
MFLLQVRWSSLFASMPTKLDWIWNPYTKVGGTPWRWIWGEVGRNLDKRRGLVGHVPGNKGIRIWSIVHPS